MRKNNILKKYILVLFFIAVLVVNVLGIILLTFIQISYSYDSPEEEKIYNLISAEEKNSYVCYMNGAGDIVDEDLSLTQLLLSDTAKKQNKFESYKLLFTLGKKDYVFSGKTVYQSDINSGKQTVIKVYEKNGNIYIVLLKNQERILDKEEFSVYLIEDKSFSENILHFKASDNKYYAYSPAWVNDLMNFNLTGKIYVFILVTEVVTFFIIKKRQDRDRTGYGSKPLKK